MTWTLRVILILVSLLVSIYVVIKIQKSQIKIEDSLYWIFFSALLLMFSFFPKMAYTLSDWLGIETPVNFVFLLIIFLLVLKVFSLSIKNSILEYKVSILAEEGAIWHHYFEKKLKQDMRENDFDEKVLNVTAETGYTKEKDKLKGGGKT